MPYSVQMVNAGVSVPRIRDLAQHRCQFTIWEGGRAARKPKRPLHPTEMADGASFRLLDFSPAI